MKKIKVEKGKGNRPKIDIIITKYLLRSLDPEKRAKLQHTKERSWLESKTLRAEKGKFSSNTSLFKGKTDPREFKSNLTRPKNE